MKWIPSPEALARTFQSVTPSAPGVEARKMFGYPACFVNGNMFTGLFQDQWIVRLSDDDRRALMKAGGEPFEPMGRSMKEYVVVPVSMVAKLDELEEWVARSLAFVSTLPPKPKAGKAAKRKTDVREKTPQRPREAPVPKVKVKAPVLKAATKVRAATKARSAAPRRSGR